MSTLGELEDELRRIREEKKRLEAHEAATAAKAEAQRRLRPGSKTPTPAIRKLCEEFSRLTREAPMTLAIEVGRKKERPQRHNFLTGLTRPMAGVFLYQSIGLKGWLISPLGGLVVSTRGDILTGVPVDSSPRHRQEGCGFYSHLEGARNGTRFIRSSVPPKQWEEEGFFFTDEHPDHKGRGPTMENDGFGIRFIKEEMIESLKRSSSM